MGSAHPNQHVRKPCWRAPRGLIYLTLLIAIIYFLSHTINQHEEWIPERLRPSKTSGSGQDYKTPTHHVDSPLHSGLGDNKAPPNPSGPVKDSSASKSKGDQDVKDKGSELSESNEGKEQEGETSKENEKPKEQEKKPANIWNQWEISGNFKGSGSRTQGEKTTDAGGDEELNTPPEAALEEEETSEEADEVEDTPPMLSNPDENIDPDLNIEDSNDAPSAETAPPSPESFTNPDSTLSDDDPEPPAELIEANSPPTITQDESSTIDDPSSDPVNPEGLTTTIVVGRKNASPFEVQWIHDELKDITHKAIYIVDDPGAPLHLQKNKGRESMVYLRYILDHYDELDDVTLFFHSARTQWHNNVLMNKDAAVMINNLRRSYVKEKGYVNARCEQYPGCPSWIKWNATKAENDEHPDRTMDLFSERLWDRIFPNRTHDPIFLAEPCCSQFAASREMIQSVPKSQWQLLHDWLGTTTTPDGYTGRIMEYIWQYLFLDLDEHCPDMAECYCKTYGLCLLDQTELIEYNDLRKRVDDLMGDLSKWDKEQGCNEDAKSKKEKEQCKKGNPFTKELVDTREKKLNLEKKMPENYGIVDP